MSNNTILEHRIETALLDLAVSNLREGVTIFRKLGSMFRTPKVIVLDTPLELHTYFEGMFKREGREDYRYIKEGLPLVDYASTSRGAGVCDCHEDTIVVRKTLDSECPSTGCIRKKYTLGEPGKRKVYYGDCYLEKVSCFLVCHEFYHYIESLRSGHPGYYTELIDTYDMYFERTCNRYAQRYYKRLYKLLTEKWSTGG